MSIEDIARAHLKGLPYQRKRLPDLHGRIVVNPNSGLIHYVHPDMSLSCPSYHVDHLEIETGVGSNFKKLMQTILLDPSYSPCYRCMPQLAEFLFLDTVASAESPEDPESVVDALVANSRQFMDKLETNETFYTRSRINAQAGNRVVALYEAYLSYMDHFSRPIHFPFIDLEVEIPYFFRVMELFIGTGPESSRFALDRNQIIEAAFNSVQLPMPIVRKDFHHNATNDEKRNNYGFRIIPEHHRDRFCYAFVGYGSQYLDLLVYAAGKFEAQVISEIYSTLGDDHKLQILRETGGMINPYDIQHSQFQGGVRAIENHGVLRKNAVDFASGYENLLAKGRLMQTEDYVPTVMI